MNRIVLALFGAAVALAVLLVVEWLPGLEPVIAPGVMHGSASAPRKDATPEQVDTAEWVQTILARPLFSQSRRPPPPETGKSAMGPNMPRLAGILVSPAGRRAIFMPDGGKALVLAEGAQVGENVIRAIAPGYVVVGPQSGGHDTRITPAWDKSHSVSAGMSAPNTPPFMTPGGLPRPFQPAGMVPQQAPIVPGMAQDQASQDDDTDNNDTPDASPQGEANPGGPPPLVPRPPPIFRPPGIPGRIMPPRRE